MTEHARPLSEWHEDIGDVLWWKFPINEPPFVGSPLTLGHQVVGRLKNYYVGGWPGYHTHWTPIEVPVLTGGELSPQKSEG